MALARKRLDEKNLKTLRELVSLPHNKYCFDCNQRGPTYVNVTIGSFVCTKCSGMLRGLTPPHRVKSISMATFTPEEVELVQNRGNDYCRRTWLGLYEGAPLIEGRDEQQIQNFMIDKYERRRYYMEPPAATRTNGTLPNTKPLGGLVQEQKALRLNGTSIENKSNASRNISITTARPTSNSKTTNFIANFESADIFNANNNPSVATQPSFANFDNNPVFNNTKGNFSIFDLQFSTCGPMLNQVPLFPKCNVNRWRMPNLLNNINQQKHTAAVPPAPPEDRYAALKDLDNALKNQPALDWNSAGSPGGSLYSSPTPAGSMYSSPSPQSMYGSPSQGQFGSIFPQENANASNPFKSGGNQLWGNGTSNGINNGSHQNPFHASDSFKMNGINQSFQPSTFSAHVNGSTWTQNPFKVGSSNGHASNPFL